MPGCYHRTLSSSSLFSNKCSQVAKSRSEYCGINQACHSTGSNYDLHIFGHNNNTNLNPSLRNNLSRSGNIVYRSGPGPGGISSLDTNNSGTLENVPVSTLPTPPPAPAPPPPDRRLLVRGLSRNAFVNIPEYQEQQRQHYYWLQQQQQQQSFPFHRNNTFEQQYQLQQEFLSKVQRRVAGSHPDISRSISSTPVAPAAGLNQNQMTPLSPFPVAPAAAGNATSPHQVSINMPSSTISPPVTRRLLPRIITKKTENSTVVLVGETRTPVKSSYTNPKQTPVNVVPLDSPQANYISPDRRSPESDDQKDSSEGSMATRASPQKTDSSIIVKDPSILKSSRSVPRPLTTVVPVTKGILSKDSTPSKSKKCRARVVVVKAKRGKRTKIPTPLAQYYRNAPLSKLKHPLEENIFSSLFITLFAIAVALLVGVPILCGLGIIAFGAVGCRYLMAVVHGLGSYTRYICSNRQHPSCRSRPPQILPRDRLAFANDVRWLGNKRRSQCQSVLHTLLVFEGSMDVATLRHLIQTRVLRAETPEGELAYPRLLQKLVSVTAGYLWELDLTFDIQNHIFTGPTHFTCDTELQQYIGQLLTQSLPMSRPLWEIRLLPSYYGSGKDTMIILRVHQCLADGMSLIRILSHSLADHQQMHVPQRPHFAGLSFGFNVLRSLIVGPVTIFLWWFATFRDRSLFSAPLPKLRRKARRKGLWWRWLRCRRDSDSAPNNGDEEETISFTSSLSSSSSYSSSSVSSESHSHVSRSSISSPNHTPAVNNGKRGKLGPEFRSPQSSTYSSSKKDELSPRTSGTQQQSQIGSPVSSLNRQNLPAEEPPLEPEEKGPQKNARNVKTGLLGRGVAKNFRCFSKNLSSSKSSLRSQPLDSTCGEGGTAATKETSSQQNSQLKPPSVKSGGSDGGKGKTRNPLKRKKKRRKKRRGGHTCHIHGKSAGKGRRRRRNASLASTNSVSSSGLSTSSPETALSSRASPTSCRPPSWNVIWSAPMTLPKVARIKQIMRSSYNDVLLSAAAGSVRMYLQEQGIPFPGDVQVSTYETRKLINKTN